MKGEERVMYLHKGGGSDRVDKRSPKGEPGGEGRGEKREEFLKKGKKAPLTELKERGFREKTFLAVPD